MIVLNQNFKNVLAYIPILLQKKCKQILKDGLLKSYLLLFMSKNNLPKTNWGIVGMLLASPIVIMFYLSQWIVANLIRWHNETGYISYKKIKDESHSICFDGFYVIVGISYFLEFIFILFVIIDKSCGCGDIPALIPFGWLQILIGFVLLTISILLVPAILSIAIWVIYLPFYLIGLFIKKTTKKVCWD
jgi:hypothetical protein